MGRVRDIVRGLPPALVALNMFFTACQSQPPASAPPAATTAAAAAQPAPAPNTTSGQGGSVTIGLDQEPPTLDPEASPSAITFYIT